MFKRFKKDSKKRGSSPSSLITSVLSHEVSWSGKLTGSGGVRIEGSYEGEIELAGILVVSPTGRVSCELLKAYRVIVAGVVRGNIMANTLEIREGGKVWGDVTTVNMSTEEGSFLRGKVTMEEELDLGLTLEIEAEEEE